MLGGQQYGNLTFSNGGKAILYTLRVLGKGRLVVVQILPVLIDLEHAGAKEQLHMPRFSMLSAQIIQGHNEIGRPHGFRGYQLENRFPNFPRLYIIRIVIRTTPAMDHFQTSNSAIPCFPLSYVGNGRDDTIVG